MSGNVWFVIYVGVYMSENLTGNVALITGASRGIGRACALSLAAEGATIVINYVSNQDAAESVKSDIESLGSQAVIVQGDVSNEEQARDVVAAAESEFGQVDILVNNAGITKFPDTQNLSSLNINAFNEIYSVNVGGAYQMCSVAEQMLKEAKGSIVNISSHSGISGMGSSIAYAASKGALNTMTLGLARAFSPDVRVNAICPGFVDTDWMSKKLDQKELQKFKKKVSEISPLQEIVSADDVAEATSWFALGGNLITGQLLVIDGGVHLTINSPII